MASEKSVLFVCLGNICRSPMAEAILKFMTSKREDSKEWRIDSCGTGNYHIGNQPHKRTLETLENNGIKNFRHNARQLDSNDYKDFKWIFVFDIDNLRDVQRAQRGSSYSNVKLLRIYDPEKDSENPTVCDPWYDGDEYFEVCYDQCTRSLQSFLEKEFN